MDRRRMDADRGRVVHRERRARKLAVVVAVQNALVAACLLVTLYVYWDVKGRKLSSGDYIHIQFEPISSISSNATLHFSDIQSSNMMSLGGENDTIYVNCTGPYILYVYVCYKSLSKEEARGMLQLEVKGEKSPLCSFALNASGDAGDVCRGLHSIAYLKATKEANLRFYNPIPTLKLKNATVGLSYLAGECDY